MTRIDKWEKPRASGSELEEPRRQKRVRMARPFQFRSRVASTWFARQRNDLRPAVDGRFQRYRAMNSAERVETPGLIFENAIGAAPHRVPQPVPLGRKWVLISSPQWPCDISSATWIWSAPLCSETRGVLDPARLCVNCSFDDKGRPFSGLGPTQPTD
jgi:hypothetical protein